MRTTGSEGGVDTSLLSGVEGVDDLVNADPDAIQQIISTLKQVADEASTAAQTLRGNTSGISWSGQAADAFHQTVGQVPSQLDTVAESYTRAANAMTAFYNAVEADQPQIISVLNQLATDHANLTTAQSNLSSAQTTQTNAHDAVANPPKGQTSAQTSTAKTNLNNANTAVSQASTQVSHLQGDITGLVAQGKRICGDFVGARSSAAAALKDAESGAPHESFWDHLLGDIKDVVSAYISFEKDIWTGIKDVAVVVGKGLWDTVKSIGDIPGDIVQIVKHPFSLTAWTHLAEGVVALGTVALMVTGVGELALGGEILADAGEGALEEGAEDLTEDALTDATSDATDDAADDAATDAEQSLKSKLATRLNQINRVANDGEAGAGKAWSQFQSVVNYGSQAEGEFDDVKDGNWKGAIEGAAFDGAGDLSGSLTEQGIDKLTGTEAAEEKAAAAETFSQAVDKQGGDNMKAFSTREAETTAPTGIVARAKAAAASQLDYSAESTMTHESAKSLLSAAGIKPGALKPGEFQKSINSIDPEKLVTSTSHALNTKKVIVKQISTSLDGQKDAGSEKLKDVIKDHTGVETADV